MNKLTVLPLFILMNFMSPVLSADTTPASEDKSANRDWHIGANISYTSRTLDGSIVNRNAVTDDVFGILLRPVIP